MFSAIHPFVKRVGVAVAAVVLVWLAAGGAFAQDPPDKHDSKVSPLLRELLASAQEPRAAAQQSQVAAADGADGGVTREVVVDRLGSKSAPPADEPQDELIRVDADGNVQVYLYMDSTSVEALAEYIARQHRHLFELLILDEVHEYKAGGSAQGIAAATLSNIIPRTIALTGTYAGGYASTLFHLLYRFSPHIRNHYAVNDVDRWVQEYGFIEKITKTKETVETVGSYTRRSTKTTTRKRERPGILPQALHHILGHSIFLRLSDIAHDLPPYREFVQRVDLNEEQEHAYRGLETSLTAAVGAALASGSPRLLGAYLQALLSYPDACTKEEIVIDPADDEGLIIGQAPALSAETRYPKEQALAALYRRERDRGRRVLVFATHTESRDITPRIAHILKEAGATPTVLKSHTVTPDKRENWIAERVTEGTDALILHPRLVQTGLDLLDFPTIVWYEPDYSIYTIRQASRRSWRIGQTEPVEVHHIVYSRTMQAAALALVASKMRHQQGHRRRHRRQPA